MDLSPLHALARTAERWRWPWLYSPDADEGNTTRPMVKRRWSTLPRETSIVSKRASNLSRLELTMAPMIAFVSELMPVV